MLKRLAPSIRKHIARLTWPKARGIVERDGVLYLLNLNHQPENWYDKHILQWGAGEPEQRAFLTENIRRREGDIFLDIGANRGVYAVCIALQTKCGTVVAYEADEGTMTGFARSSAQCRNRPSAKRIVAVSDHNGTVPFTRAPAR